MGQDNRLAQDEELEQDDDTNSEIMDGRLSAIMPRCARNEATATASLPAACCTSASSVNNALLQELNLVASAMITL
jgi:hypothetical protein